MKSMYDRHLETFIQVANNGSFLKASEQLYISANAVTKQINLLENNLGIKLFHRSNQGLTLTDAGQLIYEEAKKMIRHSNKVLQKARDLEAKKEIVIRVGVSLMNPATILLQEWQKASAFYPNFRLEVVPFQDTVPAFNEVLEHLGEKIDLISCPYETNYWGDRYQSFHFKDLPLCIACSQNHRLARKEKLIPEDLYGENLFLTKRGITQSLDPLRDMLEEHHPQVQLHDIEYLDLTTFNKLIASYDLLVSAECWSGVHPLLATIPVEWDFVLPYGLIYSKNPSKEVLQFILALGNTEN
jgi:DNA-binding transcriptional LysR family regulator